MPDWFIDHISAVTLAVHDMAESITFYKRLGLHVSYGGPNAAFTTMRAGWSVINLHRAPHGSGNRWARVIPSGTRRRCFVPAPQRSGT
jgi:catechol 2,3-dioxygenase-like lactoylglutathione lyase family enzyme